MKSFFCIRIKERSMVMKIYNSMSMKTETFHPLQEGKVSMYVCGPTVYNYPHIGNARPIVVFDTLKRTLQALGYEVKMVSNYTDVDDKIIKVAKELGVSEKEVTEKFIKAYNDDRLSLHAMMPEWKNAKAVWRAILPSCRLSFCFTFLIKKIKNPASL